MYYFIISKSKFSLGFFALISLLFLSRIAIADHIQPNYPAFILDYNVPATVCQIEGGDTQYRDYLYYSQFGSIVNMHSNRKLTVVCPVTKNPYTDLGSIQVYVTDNNSLSDKKGNASCRLRKRNRFGESDNINYLENTANMGSIGNTTLSFSNNIGFSVNSNSYLVLYCSIPPVDEQTGLKSRIHSIRVKQHEHPSQ